MSYQQPLNELFSPINEENYSNSELLQPVIPPVSISPTHLIPQLHPSFPQNYFNTDKFLQDEYLKPLHIPNSETNMPTPPSDSAAIPNGAYFLPNGFTSSSSNSIPGGKKNQRKRKPNLMQLNATVQELHSKNSKLLLKIAIYETERAVSEKRQAEFEKRMLGVQNQISWISECSESGSCSNSS